MMWVKAFVYATVLISLATTSEDYLSHRLRSSIFRVGRSRTTSHTMSGNFQWFTEESYNFRSEE